MNLPNTVPVGTIIAFAGKINAAGSSNAQLEAFGWMLCDGSSLNTSEYPQLYAVLGNLYSFSQDGGTFNLPDMKGQFFGGLNNGASTNYLIKFA